MPTAVVMSEAGEAVRLPADLPRGGQQDVPQRACLPLRSMVRELCLHPSADSAAGAGSNGLGIHGRTAVAFWYRRTSKPCPGGKAAPAWRSNQSELQDFPTILGWSPVTVHHVVLSPLPLFLNFRLRNRPITSRTIQYLHDGITPITLSCVCEQPAGHFP